MNQTESLGTLGRVPKGSLSAWGREERKGGRGVRVLGWGKEGEGHTSMAWGNVVSPMNEAGQTNKSKRN